LPSRFLIIDGSSGDKLHQVVVFQARSDACAQRQIAAIHPVIPPRLNSGLLPISAM